MALYLDCLFILCSLRFIIRYSVIAITMEVQVNYKNPKPLKRVGTEYYVTMTTEVNCVSVYQTRGLTIGPSSRPLIPNNCEPGLATTVTETPVSKWKIFIYN